MIELLFTFRFELVVFRINLFFSQLCLGQPIRIESISKIMITLLDECTESNSSIISINSTWYFLTVITMNWKRFILFPYRG